MIQIIIMKMSSILFFTTKITHRLLCGFLPEFIPMKTWTGMTEEGHLCLYFRQDKRSFLRKQESINSKFNSLRWAKFSIIVYFVLILTGCNGEFGITQNDTFEENQQEVTFDFQDNQIHDDEYMQIEEEPLQPDTPQPDIPQPDLPPEQTIEDPIPDPILAEDLTPEPVEEPLPGPCSGHGTPYTWSDGTFCACDPGYTPSSRAGNDCVPTNTVCTGGPIPTPIDTDGDGTPESTFQPSSLECLMYELVNRTRATHDNEGTPECHNPLLYNREWSAHGRQHSRLMSERGALFHDDFPWGQNCAYGCDPACEMNMYMTYPGEDHCPPLSHHCNIMQCTYSQIGIGYWTPEEGTWNTQNFL